MDFKCPCLVKVILDINKGHIKEFKYINSQYHIDVDKTFDISEENKQLGDILNMSIIFDYYQNHDFHKLTMKSNLKNSFSLFHSNIESLNANFENLEKLLTNLNFSFDVIALSETWDYSKNHFNLNFGSLNGYQSYKGIQGTTRKSGCGFYIKNEVRHVHRKDLDINFNDDIAEFQIKWVEILKTHGKHIVLGVCYRHPRKNSTKIFLSELKKKLNKIRSEKKIFILCGDFNFDILKFEFDSDINDFVDLMFENAFQPCILKPTRFTDYSKPSLIDNIFINTTSFDITSGNILDKISDHMPNFAFFHDLGSKAEKQTKMKRSFKNFNEDLFTLDLQNANFSSAIDVNRSLDQNFDFFQQLFIEIIDKHAPVIKISNKELKQQQKPWITKDILQLIYQKNKCYKKFIETQDQFYYQRYKFFRDTSNSALRKSKHEYFNQFFKEAKYDCKKYWTKINSLINKPKNIKYDNFFLQHKGKTVSDQKEIANIFNEYYINVAQNLVSKMGNTNHSFHEFLDEPVANNFFLSEISTDEIESFIDQLNIYKCADVFGISPKFVKLSKPFIVEPLKTLFNMSFMEGVFPKSLKTAKVLPIFKTMALNLNHLIIDPFRFYLF